MKWLEITELASKRTWIATQKHAILAASEKIPLNCTVSRFLIRIHQQIESQVELRKKSIYKKREQTCFFGLDEKK